MRVRQSGSGVSIPSHNHLVTTPCSGSPTTTIRSGAEIDTVGDETVMMDVVTPGFRKRSARGEVFVNPMTKNYVAYSSSPGTQSVQRSTACGTGTKTQVWKGYAMWDNACVNFLTLDDQTRSDMITAAITEARATYKRPTIDVLTNIAELPKLLTSLYRDKEQFLRAVRSVKGDWEDWRTKLEGRTAFAKRVGRDVPWQEVLDFISANWLKYRYQFVPLYLDSLKAVEIATSSVPGQDRQTVRAYQKHEQSTTVSNTFTGSFFNGTRTYECRLRVDVRAGALFQTHPKSMIETLGLNTGQLTNTAWELIPFSFIVDWFFGLGDFIAASNPLVGSKELGSWVTVSEDSTIVWRYNHTWNSVSGFNVTSNSDSFGARRSLKVERVVAPPSGMAFMRIPTWSTASFNRRLADISALAWGFSR